MTPGKTTPQKIILVTGMSGAGRSNALKVLEDLGYEAIDNLPLSLLPHLCDQIGSWERHNPLAIGIDTRSYGFDLTRFWELFQAMSAALKGSVQLLYLECDDDVLLRRFTETRRRHPIGKFSLPEAIAQERQMIDPLKSLADLTIDTSHLSMPSFGQMVRQHFSLEDSLSLLICLISFSYRRGLPREADMVFDARFLSNPYYEKPFRALSGKDEAVGEYLTKDSNWQGVYNSIQEIIRHSLKGFRLTGRSYLTLACGCTGGQHRSVFLAEQLSTWLHKEGERVKIEHRDLPIRTY
ncbi:MAG: RNase adapter RapZ [Candidatus Paracaedibacter sp.]